ncbi:hypothetical protein [Marinibacterium profundimaris]|uniref:Uncharacterized protein n=1 Tax=Marinibacterium profundimaris TaxID=1679460 RepID=A0A225NMM8_9RHOB|nr:hypothetical protein [Marinibacterium profundimaris]OWU74824.1 hypothetical protein ATO3_09525 [Marinibacterium profundimaris]
MISIEDIKDMSDLTRDEIDALALHEHVGEYDAALMGSYLMQIGKGPQQVQQMICEDIRTALHAGDRTLARNLFATLRQFMADHPGAARGASA